MTPEEAYEKALSLIREAEQTEATRLDILYFDSLTQLPLELGRLRTLQTLNLTGCEQLQNISPLTNLSTIETLQIIGCKQLQNLSPLAKFPALRWLDLSYCSHLQDLSPLANLRTLHSLHLIECEQLQNLSPLKNLTSLESLTLRACYQLRDLSPLACLRTLQTLDLGYCSNLQDLSPLKNLIALRSLDLTEGRVARRFAPLAGLLPTLESLYLYNCPFSDLPIEVCGEGWAELGSENVLQKVRAYYADLEPGACLDAEIKVLFLGNGGAGKTQLCRRLRDLPFDPNIPTTHGIQLGEMTLRLDGFPEPVRLNLWDFGGQDIYHGSHALFLHGQAIFLILWTPKLECQTTYQEGALSFRHRPLSYWLDYRCAFARTDASVLIVQSQCDSGRDRAMRPPAKTADFFLRWLEVSAKTGLGLNLVKAALEESVRDCFERRPPPPIGAGRIKVRDRLRQMLKEDQEREPGKRQHRLLERAEFDRLCDEAGGVSDSSALLDFLHHNGVVFYRPGLFGDRIVLDQDWALEAIYALFDRKKIMPLLRGYGRFSRADLEALIWSDYTPEEQKVFLGMMESCGICFRVRNISDEEWEYIAPELLPKWSDAQEQLLGRLHDDPPDAQATARYAFLHEGILRSYLSKLGEHAKDAAIYWKYGCWFYEKTTRSQVLIESKWEDAVSEADAGEVRFRAWGERADDLMEQLLRTLQTLPVGQPPEIKRIHNAKVVITARVGVSSHATVAQDTGRLDNLEIPVRHELPPKGTPEIFVSFGWGDDSSQEARKRTEIVDRLCESLRQHGWHILRDSNVLRYGDLISGFMKRIGLADHVIVVLSDKYLRSPYCMTELHSIYQRSVGEKEEFLRRIIPLALEDARFGNRRDRLVYAEHWKQEFQALNEDLRDENRRLLLGREDFADFKAMQQWYPQVSDMLRYMNDVLHPHGFDEIVKDDFASLRQMLQRHR